MIVKRIGNDVYLTWEINKKDGSPEDFSNVLDMKVYIRRSFLNKLYEQKFEVTGNVIKLHYIAAEQAGIGSYDLCAKWTKPDPMVEGRIASFVVDYRNAFKLIGFDETVPDQQDETFVSQIYEAIKGDKGDSSYQTWLDAGNTGTEADYLAWIRQPATDIEQVVSSNETVRISSEETRQLNETARVEAEALRGSAETQRISNENTRKSNETGRINAETLRLSAEQERGTAEGLRVSSETSRNTAEGQRAAAETARATAEGLRAAAETARVTAEQGRFDAELLRVGSESARNDAEGLRDSAEDDRILAEGIRDANETVRINAESDREDAEDLRDQAEVAREEAEGLRQTNTNTAIQAAVEATTAANTATGLAVGATTAANTAARDANDAAEAANTAAGLANNAATTANTAAGLADTARLAIQDDLALKANHGYESNPKTLKEVDDEKADHGYASIEVAKTLKEVEDDTVNTIEKPAAQSLSELNARITALEAILTNKIKDRIDVTKEFNVWGKTNLILYGDGASTKTPDFIGQTYIDTTNGNVYIAVGVSNAENWKLV